MNIRQRALRAARAVTMTFAVAGCGTAATEELDTADAAFVAAADAADIAPDSGVTAMCPQRDNVCSDSRRTSDPDCCDQSGGSWFCNDRTAPGGTCGVPGPFVPPAIEGEPA